MYTIGICDDNRLHAGEVERAATALLGEDAAIRGFYTAAALREAVNGGARFDILFMDIKLSEESGIALVRELFPKGCGTQVIYITAYMDYCTKVYETDHIWFLTKPLAEEELKQALGRAVQNLKTEKAGRIPVKFGERIQLLSPGDILYAESEKRRLHIHTEEGDLITYQTLAQFAQGLDRRFLLCHKSFLVNMDQVEALESSGFALKDGSRIPISRQRYGEARQAFLDYIGETL